MITSCKLGVLAALLALTACAPAPPTDNPSIQAKADAFSTKLQEQMRVQEEIAAESLIIDVTVPKGRPLSVFYAGDSLSYGLYSSTEANGYRFLVNEELRRHGSIAEQRATKSDPNALFKAGNVMAVPESGVDLAILELGTNDMGTADIGSRTPIDQFYDDYVALVDSVQRSKDVQLICVGVWGSGGPTISDPYDFEIRKVCEQRGGQYVDLTAAFELKDTFGPEGSPSWLGPSDNFHPNDKGHRLIANLILERIRFV